MLPRWLRVTHQGHTARKESTIRNGQVCPYSDVPPASCSLICNHLIEAAGFSFSPLTIMDQGRNFSHFVLVNAKQWKSEAWNPGLPFLGLFI